MRDVFYTILVIWILWRVIHSINTYRSNKTSSSVSNDQAEVKHSYSSKEAKRKMADSEGEYVDYEEVK
ncbi:MAG: hypothetical protein J0L87_07770 [Bacteroidetes bacterium]|nr:hypothetical protein [Bacteroidota bacterium]